MKHLFRKHFRYFAKGIAICLVAMLAGTVHAATADKPNIIIIWGDDIGQSNISAYSMGLMGYQTPNIDRVAKAGMIFTGGSCLLYHRPERLSHRIDQSGDARGRPGHEKGRPHHRRTA